MSENTTPAEPAGQDVGGHRIVDKVEDVEGHRLYVTQPEKDENEDDDVEGHVQPRRDLDIER
jgi:hypothetical protein